MDDAVPERGRADLALLALVDREIWNRRTSSARLACSSKRWRFLVYLA